MASSPLEVSWQERCGAFLFTIVGGYLDAYAYIAHGGVFANAQTGNVVLLAINVAETDWTEALRHLLPILTFSAAAMIVSLLNQRWDQHTTRIRVWSAAVEAGVLLIILALQTKLPNSFIVPMISFAAAVQITSFNSMGGVSFNSAMTTGNLRETLKALSQLLAGQNPKQNREKFLTIGTVCLCFLLGALLGAGVTKRHPAYCLLVPLAAIAAAATLLGVPPPPLASNERSSRSLDVCRSLLCAVPLKGCCPRCG